MLSRRRFPHLAAPRIPLRGLLCAAVCGLSPLGAQNLALEEEEETGGEPAQSSLFAADLLPDGSILKGVLLPRYARQGANLRISSTVRADELVIVDRKRLITAKNLVIEMSGDEGGPGARIATKAAKFLIAKNLLTSKDPVSIVAEKLTADGAGLVFDVEKSRGFLRGPVKAVTEIDTRTAMNARPARNALAAGGALLMAAAPALPAQEAQPATAELFSGLRLKPEQLEQVKAEAASRADQVRSASRSAAATAELARTDAESARLTMEDFFHAAALPLLAAGPGPDTGDVPLPEVPPNPLKTTITSKDGAYFDSIAGLAIFLKDVEVKNPEFQLKGADELKIFMNPQEPEPEPKQGAKPKPAVEKEITPEMAEKMRAAKEAAAKLAEEGGAEGGDFGDVKRLVATGVVEIFYQPDKPGEEPLMASARTVIYDLEKEQIILRGGSPWILREGKLSQVMGNEAYFLVHIKDGEPLNFVTGNQELLKTEFSTEEMGEGKKGKKPAQKPKNR